MIKKSIIALLLVVILCSLYIGVNEYHTRVAQENIYNGIKVLGVIRSSILHQLLLYAENNDNYFPNDITKESVLIPLQKHINNNDIYIMYLGKSQKYNVNASDPNNKASRIILVIRIQGDDNIYFCTNEGAAVYYTKKNLKELSKLQNIDSIKDYKKYLRYQLRR